MAGRVDSIPLEITRDILSRLPVKTLVRFRLACKQWEATICDREFKLSSVVRKHFTVCNRKKRRVSFFASSLKTSGSRFFLEPYGGYSLPKNYDFAIRGFKCVHGLMLIETVDTIVIWNPSLRVKKTLPRATYPCMHLLEKSYGPAVLHFDPDKKEYLCFRLVRNPQDGMMDCMVIGLKDSNWRKLQRPQNCIPWVHGYSTHTSSVYFEGFLYLAPTSGLFYVKVCPSEDRFERLIRAHFGLVTTDINFLFVYEGKVAVTVPNMRTSNDRCLYTLEKDEAELSWKRMQFADVVDTTKADDVAECEKCGITGAGEILLFHPEFRMRNTIYHYNPLSGELTTVVAQVTGSADFVVQYDEEYPQALLQTIVEDLTLLSDA